MRLRHMTPLGNTSHKLIITAIYGLLKHSLLLGCKRREEIGECGLGVGGYHVDVHSKHLGRLLHAREHTEDSDRTSQRQRVGEDSLGLGRNPIAAGGRIVAHRHDYRFTLRSEKVERLTNLCAAVDRPAGRINAQHEGLYPLVGGQAIDDRYKLVVIDLALVAIIDAAYGIQYGNLSFRVVILVGRFHLCHQSGCRHKVKVLHLASGCV